MYTQINSITPVWGYVVSCIIFIPALTLVITYWFLYNHHKREKKLEQQIAERTKTIVTYSQTITKLKYAQKELSAEKKLKEQLISIVIHDLKSPLRFLSMHMEKLQENLKSMNSEELKNYTLLLKNTVNDVCLFTQDILLWLNNQEDFNIIKKKTSIKDLIFKTTKIYQDICLSNNNRIKILIKEDIIINTAPDLLNVIVRNILDNANKFTNNGIITITIGIKDQFTFITITDTGMGMDKDKVSELINPTLNNWNIQTTRIHLGYKIINDLIQKLGGTLQMTSELKKGTSVTILLPAN